MTTRIYFSLLIIASLSLVSCGGGSTPSKALLADPIDEPVDGSKQELEVSTLLPIEDPVTFPALASHARYRVTLENFWGDEDFPQEFPESAHLSLIGGATHNAAASFWELGEVASSGIEDMAEAGLIDRLLFDEVAPAILNGTANSMIEIREYTDAQIDGVPGVQVFELELDINWPLVSMVTMLGPSPDWFVGVSGLSLQREDEWLTRLSIDLPLYDGGSKSDITPIMGGADIIPPNPISLVAYDAATGVYLASDEPQMVARLTLERIALN